MKIIFIYILFNIHLYKEGFRDYRGQKDELTDKNITEKEDSESLYCNVWRVFNKFVHYTDPKLPTVC